MANDKELKLKQAQIAEKATNKLMLDYMLSLFVGALLIFLYRGFNGSGAGSTRDIVGWIGVASAILWVGYWVLFLLRKKHTYFRLDWFFLLLAAGAGVFFIPYVRTQYIIYAYAALIPVYWVGVAIFYLVIYRKWMMKKLMK